MKTKERTAKDQAKDAIKWISALRTHKKTIEVLSDGRGGYCCLGVGVKVLKTGEKLSSDITAPNFADRVGLKNEMGGFFNQGRICKAVVLTELNDKVFKEDKTFKNIRREILGNLRKVFSKPVADILRKHYKK